MHIHHVVHTEVTPDGSVRAVERHHAAVSDADAKTAVTALATALVEDDGRLPMHINKRQPRGLQRPLPGRKAARRRRAAAAAKLLNGIAEIGFRPAKQHAPGRHFETRKPFLQRGLGLALQSRVDGRVNRVGFRREARDAVGFRFAAQEIDEMQAAVAPPLLVRDKPRSTFPWFESYSGGLGKLVGPSVDDGMAIDVVDAGDDALLEFVL